MKVRHPEAARVVRSVARVAARRWGLPVSQIVAPGPRPSKAAGTARIVTTYLCHVGLSLSAPEIAECLGRDIKSVTYSFGRVEDLRDDAAFDALLEEMEAEVVPLRQLLRPIAVGPGALL